MIDFREENSGIRFEITFWQLWIFITVVWLLVRTFFAIKNKKIDIKHEVKLLTVYVCLVVVSRFVYFPLGLENGHIKPLVFDSEKITPIWYNLVPIKHMFDHYDGWLVNIIGNIAMFIPVGACWPFCFKRLNTVWKSILAGFGLTLFIELSQLVFYDRCSDIDDLIMNGTGAIIGSILYFIFRRKTASVKEASEK